MSTLLPENFETVSPTDSDARLALESSRILASRKLGKKTSVRIRLGDDDPSEGVVVPTSAVIGALFGGLGYVPTPGQQNVAPQPAPERPQPRVVPPAQQELLV